MNFDLDYREFPIISDTVLNVHLQFCTAYLCEVLVSASVMTKSRYGLVLNNTEGVLYRAVPNIQPRAMGN